MLLKTIVNEHGQRKIPPRKTSAPGLIFPYQPYYGCKLSTQFTASSTTKQPQANKNDHPIKSKCV